MGLQGEVAKCRKETGATIANNAVEEVAPVEAENSSIIDAVVEGCESVLHAVENAAAACVDAMTTPAVEGVEQVETISGSGCHSFFVLSYVVCSIIFLPSATSSNEHHPHHRRCPT